MCCSGEQSLGEITATVLVYAEKWVPNGQAKVIICYTAADNTCRFLGLRDQDVSASAFSMKVKFYFNG
jgi:hypothetical protein